MSKLRRVGIGAALLLVGVMAAGCGEVVYQVGTTPPPAPEPPPPPPPPPPVVVQAPVVEAPKIAQDTGDEIKITQQINFANNSDEIEPGSRPVIEAVANVMKEHPDINFLEVAGHASKTGSAAINTPLTNRRATAVMNALIALGVDANRMRAVGYGFYCPLDGGNEDANRRVEFKVLRRGGKDTAYKWGGCDPAKAKGIQQKPIPASAPK